MLGTLRQLNDLIIIIIIQNLYSAIMSYADTEALKFSGLFLNFKVLRLIYLRLELLAANSSREFFARMPIYA